MFDIYNKVNLIMIRFNLKINLNLFSILLLYAYYFIDNEYKIYPVKFLYISKRFKIKPVIKN